MNVALNAGFHDPTFDYNSLPRGSRRPMCALAVVKAVRYFETRGHAVLAFIPEWCLDGGRNKDKFAYRHELLRPLANRNVLVLTPSRMDDDNWAIGHAQRTEDCLIVTNDHLRNFVQRGTITQEWRDAHVMKFAWVQNELMPYPYQRK